MRASALLRATLRLPSVYAAGQVGLLALDTHKSITSNWGNAFIGQLGCKLVPAPSPAAICSLYDTIQVGELPKTVRAVVNNDVTDRAVKSVHKWMKVMQYGHETFVDRFAAEVLHASDLDEGEHTVLLPQEELACQIGALDVTSKPHLLLRCTRSFAEEEDIIYLVTQSSKPLGSKALAWGQIVGEMLVAALKNSADEPHSTPNYIVGLRVIDTRFIFLRATFPSGYLERLSGYRLEPTDLVEVVVWGGEPASNLQQTGNERWGLEFKMWANAKASLECWLHSEKRQCRWQNS
jgi:hypothetical protein